MESQQREDEIDISSLRNQVHQFALQSAQQSEQTVGVVRDELTQINNNISSQGRATRSVLQSQQNTMAAMSAGASTGAIIGAGFDWASSNINSATQRNSILVTGDLKRREEVIGQSISERSNTQEILRRSSVAVDTQGHAPMFVNQRFSINVVAAAQSPVAVAQVPVAVAQDPVVVAQDPVASAQDPVAAAQDPVVVAQDPVVVAQDPVAVAQDPVAVAQVAVTQEADNVVFSDPVRIESLRGKCLLIADAGTTRELSKGARAIKKHFDGNSVRPSQAHLYPEIDRSMANNNLMLNAAAIGVRSSILCATDAVYQRRYFHGEGPEGAPKLVLEVSSAQQGRGMLFDLNDAREPIGICTVIQVHSDRGVRRDNA